MGSTKKIVFLNNHIFLFGIVFVCQLYFSTESRRNYFRSLVFVNWSHLSAWSSFFHVLNQWTEIGPKWCPKFPCTRSLVRSVYTTFVYKRVTLHIHGPFWQARYWSGHFGFLFISCHKCQIKSIIKVTDEGVLGVSLLSQIIGYGASVLK